MTKQSILTLLVVVLASVFATEACEMYFQQYVDPTCTEAEDELPAIVGIGSTLPNTCSGSIDGPKGSAYIWKCTDDGLGVSITWCAPDSVVASSSTCLMCEQRAMFFTGTDAITVTSSARTSRQSIWRVRVDAAHQRKFIHDRVKVRYRSTLV